MDYPYDEQQNLQALMQKYHKLQKQGKVVFFRLFTGGLWNALLTKDNKGLY